jgi:predicted adenylyl cyclase CyaB
MFKIREEFRFIETNVALDKVDNLGGVVEIEVITDDRESALEKIETVRKELEITGEHIPDSYLEMILNKSTK